MAAANQPPGLGTNATPPPKPAGALPTVNVSSILTSERFVDLNQREKFYLCTQHDHKMHDFSGRVLPQGGIDKSRAPMLANETSSFYVPLSHRRPSSPYRLGKVIVNRFTSMLFGSQRWPTIRVEGDADTQDFCEALIEATALPSKMIQARNIGGSVGTVGLSWCIRNGKPIVNVHNGKYLYVSEWEDRDTLTPAVVTEVFLFPKQVFNPTTKKFEKKQFWYRRDWTKTEDIGYDEVMFEAGVEPQFTKNEVTSATHDDGFCHFVWIQNLKIDEEDGLPDYDGLYDNFDALDLLLSVLTRGMTLNLDPTLVLNLDPDIVKRMGVKKGSDNALIVGLDGDAKYLEIGGQSVDAGIKLFNLKRKSCLEVAECVLTDPDSISSGQTSSLAIQKIYEPMIAACDVRREQYGEGLKRLLLQMLVSARKHLDEMVDVKTADGEDVELDLDGEPQKAVPYLDLPLKVVTTDEMDELGKPTGEISIEMEDRIPGEGGDIELQWGPYFPPSAEEHMSLITALNMAVGGKAIMSPQTASEIICAAFGRNPAAEWKRLTEHSQAEDDKAAAEMAAGGMFGGDPGGKAPPPGQEAPPGGAPPGGAPPGGAPPAGGAPAAKPNPFAGK